MSGRQVLVVGGGVEGLTASAFLSRRGLSPIVVNPGGDGCRLERDVVLWGPAVALLAELVPLDDLLETGTPLRQWHLRRASDGTTERLTGAHDEEHPPLSVDRASLRHLLREQLPVGSVRLSKTPQRLSPTEHGLRVEFTDGVREQFDCVVGADGAESWVRTSCADTLSPVRWEATAWHVQTGELIHTPNAVTDIWSPAMLLSCHPSGRGLCLIPTGDTTDATGSREEAITRLSALFERFDGVSTPAVGEQARLLGVSSERWAADRVGFVGSAARSLPPASSLGPSLAVEDAAVLATELTQRPLVAEVLDRYARRRRSRLRTLGQYVPLRTTPSTGRCGLDTFRAVCSLRTTLIRWFFGRHAATTDPH